jgi:ribonuclease P protein component
LTASSEISTRTTNKASFPKGERLCGIKAINVLFASGRSINLNLFRAVYSSTEESTETSSVRVLISVPRRHFKKAVTRNLLRRRIKEAYRKNKQPLLESLKKKGRCIDLAIIWSATEPAGYLQIEDSVKELINRLLTIR